MHYVSCLLKWILHDVHIFFLNKPRLFLAYSKCSGAPGSVGTTPIHPELGGEKAEGITELDGQLSGIVILVPESFFTYWLKSIVKKNKIKQNNALRSPTAVRGLFIFLFYLPHKLG